MTKTLKSMVLLGIFLPIATAKDDGAIIFEEEEEERSSPLVPIAFSKDESSEARQNFLPTFRQPGLGANRPCRDARFAIGTCLSLSQCPSLFRIALNPKHPDYPFLQWSACGNFKGSQYFCCKAGQSRVETSSNQQQSKPADSSSCITSDKINFDSCGISKLFGNRVVGGKVADPNSSPWIALLLESSLPICGASLITNQHAISAAHCFVRSSTGTVTKTSDFIVRLAEHDVSTTTDGKHHDMEVNKIIVHEAYNTGDKQNDIAIIRLKRKVCFSSRVKPICIPGPEWNRKDLQLYKAIVAGWGLEKTLGSSSNVLRQAELSIYNTDECRANYSIKYRKQARAIDGTTICSGDSEGRVDSCKGDSGGPLVVSQDGKFYLVGVVSRGPVFCGTKGLPGIYTRVSVYYQWILKNIQIT